MQNTRSDEETTIRRLQTADK